MKLRPDLHLTLASHGNGWWWVNLKCGTSSVVIKQKRMKKDYSKLRETTRFTKTIGITLKVYQWIENNRQKKSRAAFLDDFIEENNKPNLFKKHK